MRSGNSSSSSAENIAQPPASAGAPPVIKSDASTARLQIRLPSGPPLTQQFNATDKLKIVMDFIAKERPEAARGTLSMTFPRKQFGPADLDKTLKELDLVPSAALVLALK